MTKLQRRLLYSLLLFIALFTTLSIFTNSNADSTLLFDNIFLAQSLTIIFLYLISRDTKISRGLGAALIASAALVVFGNIIGRYGPGVVTEADHPATIRYICIYYGDDLPVLQGHKDMCYIKNSVTLASNPSWLLLDKLELGAPSQQEKLSRMLTFAAFEACVGGAYYVATRKKKHS